MPQEHLSNALVTDLYRVDGVVSIGACDGELTVEFDPDRPASRDRLQELVNLHGKELRVVLRNGADTMRSECY